NRRDLPKDTPQLEISVLRYDGDECDKRIMPTKIELTLEQSQQGVSNDVLVSIEGVEELKRNVWIKGLKKEALHYTLGRNQNILCFELKTQGDSLNLPDHMYSIYTLERETRASFQQSRIQHHKGAMPPMEVCEGLGLYELKNRKWHIQGTCALRGDGLYEGLDWLASTLMDMKAASTSSF
nr:ADP-ribosylation factor 1-like 2 [Tanacetum cinerariifolium]